MILNKNSVETDSFLDVNNDIYRIITAFNNSQELKKLLIHTTKKPLEGKKIDADLRDKQIARVPLIPYDEEEGSIIVVSLISGEIDPKTEAMHSILAIDVFTPGNQWIINEGIRPLQLCHCVANIMKYELNQTGGVKYRMTDIINAQLSDILMGYRMLFEVIIDD